MVVEYLYHTVDAGHIRNLGEQSVSNKIQAVLELVKNSYDADALSCTVTFHGETVRNKKIKIEKITVDDMGIGMTKYDLQAKFMKVGTGSKIRKTFSPKFHRRVSGEKGMGHYSMQRLGNKVTITTTPEPYENREFFTKEDNATYVLEMNWENYKEGEDFEKIGNKLEIKNKEKNFGTKIEITDLKDSWIAHDEENDLTLLSRNLASLVLPKELQESKKQQFMPTVAPDGFEVKIPEQKNILDFALYKITAHLRENKFYFKIFERKNKEFVPLPGEDPVTITAQCGKIADLTIYWFPGLVKNWAPGLVKPRILKDQLEENHGIKIYNDNIRIMPYGEKGNDWLGLDTRKARPAAGGKVRNDHLIGFVKMSRENNPDIVETTTRQALKENLAFNSLKDDFVMRAIAELEDAVQLVKKDREKKVQHANVAIVEIERVKESLRQENLSVVMKNEYLRRLSFALKNIELAEREKNETMDELASNIEMYRNLSTVGVQTLAFNHEIINPIRFVGLTLDELIQSKTDISKNSDKLKQCIRQIEHSLSWANFVKEFSSLLAGADVAKKISLINMDKTIRDIRAGFSGIFDVTDIKMKDPIFIGEIPVIRMNKASFESIFVNLISNSIRALRKVDRKRYIKIEISKTESDIVIEFEDNGYGIADENRKKIFVPFFTTYTDDEDKGTGMGLTIIKEIVEGEYKGKVFLKKTICEKTDEGKGLTVFVIQLPKEKVT